MRSNADADKCAVAPSSIETCRQKKTKIGTEAKNRAGTQEGENGGETPWCFGNSLLFGVCCGSNAKIKKGWFPAFGETKNWEPLKNSEKSVPPVTVTVTVTVVAITAFHPTLSGDLETRCAQRLSWQFVLEPKGISRCFPRGRGRERGRGIKPARSPMTFAVEHRVTHTLI